MGLSFRAHSLLPGSCLPLSFRTFMMPSTPTAPTQAYHRQQTPSGLQVPWGLLFLVDVSMPLSFLHMYESMDPISVELGKSHFSMLLNVKIKMCLLTLFCISLMVRTMLAGSWRKMPGGMKSYLCMNGCKPVLTELSDPASLSTFDGLCSFPSSSPEVQLPFFLLYFLAVGQF